MLSRDSFLAQVNINSDIVFQIKDENSIEINGHMTYFIAFLRKNYYIALENDWRPSAVQKSVIRILRYFMSAYEVLESQLGFASIRRLILLAF